MSQLNRRATLFLLLAVSLFSTACGSMSMEAKGPMSEDPTAGQARVYFVLNQGFPTGRANIVEGAKLMGQVKNNQHFFIDIPAGEHLFMLAKFERALKGNFEVGKSYHIKLFITPLGVHWVPLEARGDDLNSRKKALEETTRVELIAEKATKWESSRQEDLLELEKEFRSGEEGIDQFIESKHGL